MGADWRQIVEQPQMQTPEAVAIWGELREFRGSITATLEGLTKLLAARHDSTDRTVEEIKGDVNVLFERQRAMDSNIVLHAKEMAKQMNEQEVRLARIGMVGTISVLAITCGVAILAPKMSASDPPAHYQAKP